jgi:hypothetical protein
MDITEQFEMLTKNVILIMHYAPSDKERIRLSFYTTTPRTVVRLRGG